ncbi:MAG: FtsQ-type POTRA domain-containing protein, partial [Dehalococcoidia bacterium]|nr:FtsQ-type POTRA domain-containing protein [Dehalococcoidia bacterium]
RRMSASRRVSAKRKRAFWNYLEQVAQGLQVVAGERRVLAVVLLPILLLAGMFAAYNLSWLQVAQVEIVGAKELDTARAKISLHLEGKNMLTIDTPMIEKVLRQQPVVKDVTVRRQWPNKVVIQVGERRPFAFWQTPEGLFVVDEEGYVLSQSPSPGPLPAIIAQEGGIRVGSRVPQGILGLSRELLTRMQAETGGQPRQFQYSAAQGLSVITSQGWKAVFGDERDLDSKLAILAAVLRAAKERKLEFQYVDLRYGDRPFLR